MVIIIIKTYKNGLHLSCVYIFRYVIILCLILINYCIFVIINGVDNYICRPMIYVMYISAEAYVIMFAYYDNL